MADSVTRPPGTTAFQDTGRWQGAFGVPSDSNPAVLYIVSYDRAGGYWVCSCPGGIHRGECKHLKRNNRSPTRADAKRAIEEAEERSRGLAAQAKLGRSPTPTRPPQRAAPVRIRPAVFPASEPLPPSTPSIPTAAVRAFAADGEV